MGKGADLACWSTFTLCVIPKYPGIHKNVRSLLSELIITVEQNFTL